MRTSPRSTTGKTTNAGRVHQHPTPLRRRPQSCTQVIIQMLKAYFESTRETLKSLTDTFDFLWPTTAAMWNLRWQVQGLVGAYPQITDKELQGRFVAGTGISGANLKRSCIDQSWERQQQRFAEILLTSTFALYESWCDQILSSLGHSNSEWSKRLQFPTEYDSGGTIPKRGVGKLLPDLLTHRSPFLSAAFYPKFASRPKCDRMKIESYLQCYRYFKEVRNCLMHNGGLADKKLLDAATSFAKCANTTSLGTKEVPEHASATLDAPISLSLRGVVGFSDIVTRLMLTLDAELMQAEKAEDECVKLWRRRFDDEKIGLPSNAVAKANKVNRLAKKLGLPLPAKSSDFEQFLRAHGFVV